MLGDVIKDLVDIGVKIVGDKAKASVSNLLSTENLQKTMQNLITRKTSAGVPPAKAREDAINEVASMTAGQVQDIANRQSAGIPTWVIIAGIGAVAVAGTIIIIVTRRRRV